MITSLRYKRNKNLASCAEPMKALLAMPYGDDKSRKAEEVFETLCSINMLDGTQISVDEMMEVIIIIKDLKEKERVQEVVQKVASQNMDCISFEPFIQILALLDGSDHLQDVRSLSSSVRNRLGLRKSNTQQKSR